MTYFDDLPDQMTHELPLWRPITRVAVILKTGGSDAIQWDDIARIRQSYNALLTALADLVQWTDDNFCGEESGPDLTIHYRALDQARETI